MITIKNKKELEYAIQKHETTIHVDDANLSKILILVYRLQNGFIHDSVIEHIVSDRPCKIAVGEGVMYEVDDALIKQVMSLNQRLSDSKIELDVVEIVNTQINIFYGNSINDQ